MEEIKTFILDFIFSGFDGIYFLFKALLSFDVARIREVCYQLGALQYLSVVMILFFAYRLLKAWLGYVKSKIKRLFAFRLKKAQSNVKDIEKVEQATEYTGEKLAGWQKRIKFNLQVAAFKLKEIASAFGIESDRVYNLDQNQAEIEESNVLCNVKEMIIKSKQCPFIPKRVLNSKESQLFEELITIVKGYSISVFPQVPLRAFFTQESGSLAHYVVGGMYVDFLLVDIKTKAPLCVIEYFGEGHYGKGELQKAKVSNNDEIKRAIFEKAKLEFIVIKAEMTMEETLEQLNRMLERLRFNNCENRLGN